LIVAYIDSVAGNRDGDGLRWCVESICVQLTELSAKIAPSTYYELRDRPPTARERPGTLTCGRSLPRLLSRTTASTVPGRSG
jgi:hypothetical protein